MKSLFSKLKSRITHDLAEASGVQDASIGAKHENADERVDSPVASEAAESGILRRPVSSAPKPHSPPWLSRGHAAPANAPETKGPETEASQKIAMELGDFIRRIPPDLLAPGPHDLKQRVWFKISDLSANVEQGKPTIPLSQLAGMFPELFAQEITPERDAEIYFPWNKLVAQMRAARSNPGSAEVFSSIVAKAAQVRSQRAINRRDAVTESVATPEVQPQSDEAARRPPVASLKSRWQNRAGQTPASPPEIPAALSLAQEGKTPLFPPLHDVPLPQSAPLPAISNKESEELSQKLPAAQAEIDSLHTRLKELMAERDAAVARNAELLESAKAQSEALAGQDQQQTEALVRERDDALAQLASLRATQERLSEEQAGIVAEKESAIALLKESAGEAKLQIERLAAERDALRHQHDQARTEFAGTHETLAEKIETLSKELGQAAEAHATAQTELTELRLKHEKLLHERDALTVEKDTLAARLDQATEAAMQQIEKLVAGRDALQQQNIETQSQITGEREELRSKLDSVREQQALAAKERDDALAELAQLRETHAKQIEALAEECNRVREEKQTVLARFAQGTDAAQRQIDALMAERDEALARLSRNDEAQKKQSDALLLDQLTAMQKEHDAAVKDWQGQIETLNSRLDAVNKERDESQTELLRLRKAQEEMSALLESRERAAASELDQLRKQLEAAERAHGEQLAILVAERDAAIAESDETLARSAQVPSSENRSETDLAPSAYDAPGEPVLPCDVTQPLREAAFALPLVRPVAPPPPVLHLRGK